MGIGVGRQLPLQSFDSFRDILQSGGMRLGVAPALSIGDDSQAIAQRRGELREDHLHRENLEAVLALRKRPLCDVQEQLPKLSSSWAAAVVACTVPSAPAVSLPRTTHPLGTADATTGPRRYLLWADLPNRQAARRLTSLRFRGNGFWQ